MPKGWITPRHGRGVMSLLSVISVASDGTIFWNGRKVSEEQFSVYLKETTGLTPLPVTQIKFADGVDCGTVERLRRAMVQTLDCGSGKCAEGSGKWWFIGDVVFPGVANEPFDPDASPPEND